MKEKDQKGSAYAEFDDWREPLLASLRDCGAQPAPRYAVLRYGLAVLVFAITMAVAGIASRLMNEGLRNAPPPVYWGAYGLLFLFIVAVLARIRNRFLRQAWQSSARSAEQELARIGSRRPVLYLRSFGLDEKVGRPSWSERYLGTRPFANAEQQLTVELRKLGPVVAIGRPGEKLPALGAARFYVSDDRWQEKVIDVIRCAQLVVWATGVTEGLRWEISHLTESLHPRRLILWAHPHLLSVSAEKREAEWQRFRETLGGVFPKPLPESLGDARFFVFDADWNPRPVLPRVTDAFTNPQKSSLHSALRLQQNGFDDPVANRPRILDPRESVTDFGGLIGARGPDVNWRLVAVFAITLFAVAILRDLSMAVYSGYYYDDTWSLLHSANGILLTTALQTASALYAFRFMRHAALATLAAAIAMTLIGLLRNPITPIDDAYGLMQLFPVRLGLRFLAQFAFFGGLAWAVARCSPLFVALLMGYLIGAVVSSLSRSYYGEFGQVIMMSLGYSAVFAALYVTALKLLPLTERR